MNLVTISIIIATTIFVAYNAVAIPIFGIPESLRITISTRSERIYSALYLVQMMPAWITLSEGSSFQFLAFLAPASIAFVGNFAKVQEW